MIVKLLNILRSYVYLMIIRHEQYSNLLHDPYDSSMLVQGVAKHKSFVTSRIVSVGTLWLWFRILVRWHRWLMISTNSYELYLLRFLARSHQLKYRLRGTNTLRSAQLIPGTKLIQLSIDSSYSMRPTVTYEVTIDENGLEVYPRNSCTH